MKAIALAASRWLQEEITGFSPRKFAAFCAQFKTRSGAFVQLQLHRECSFLDGAVRMKELMKKAKEFEMLAVDGF